jgi:hypothetical protein
MNNSHVKSEFLFERKIKLKFHESEIRTNYFVIHMNNHEEGSFSEKIFVLTNDIWVRSVCGSIHEYLC